MNDDVRNLDIPLGRLLSVAPGLPTADDPARTAAWVLGLTTRQFEKIMKKSSPVGISG